MRDGQDTAAGAESGPAAEGQPGSGAGGGAGSGAGDLAAGQIEAPEALFELDIGDAEVDFFLEGTWRASLFGSLGMLIDPDGRVFPSPFPGWDSGLVFSQTPDLTFSVWLLDRFFIEASVIGDFREGGYDYFDQNYILMGYMGTEERFLRRVLIGSRDIGIDPFPFIEVPESGLSSLGVEALLGGDFSEHQLLLRYDNNEPDSLTFIGRNMVSEQVIGLDEYLRGRFFKLPDAGVDAGSLVVYLEDQKGSYTDSEGRRYRRATVEEAALDSTNGTVFLREAAGGRVLVYYEKGGLEVGTVGVGLGADAFPYASGGELDLSVTDPGLLPDFDWDLVYLSEPMSERQVLVGGDTCLLLYRPGEFSPFEIPAAYALDAAVPEDLSRLRVSIVRKGVLNWSESTEVGFRLTPGEDFIQAYYKPDPGLRDGFRNLYPFLDAAKPSPPFDPDNLLYGPLADAKPGYLDYEILVSELTPVSAYRVGSDVVPGSVQILRNGIAETRFEVDAGSGLITFLTEIGPDDRLVVSFRRRASLANNGDILFAWGNTFPVSEALNLQLATGVRWNFLPGSYTDEAYSRTGSVILSAGAEGTVGPLSYQAEIGGAYSNPDTTGVMRLLGMESTGIGVPLSENTAYPASPPDGDDPFSSALDGFIHANRGKLLYKDYRSYGLLGTSTLMPYTWDPPSDQVYAYDQTGSKPGPYVVEGSAEGLYEGQSLVLDFDLEVDEWAGVQLPVAYDGAVSDLSRMQGISLLYRTLEIDSGSDFTVYLQLGAIGEDLDEDGILDEELSASAAGFTFDEGNYGVNLRVGSGPKNEGNGRLDSEDIDGNGFLDLDDPSADPDIITLGGPALTDTVGWTSYTHTFSTAEKRRLARTRSLRLIVVREGGSDATGRLLLDEVVLAGSRFSAGWVLEPAAPELSAREVEEWEMRDPPSRLLQATWGEVADIFHPYEETQKVMEVSWSGTSAGTWRARSYTEAQTEGIRYRSIVYYTHSSTDDGDLLSFSLGDEEGNEITWSYPPFSSTEWQKIVVDLEEGRIYRDGAELTGAGVTVSEPVSYGSLGLFTVELTDAGPGTGTLHIDELHLTDPAGSLGAGATLDLELSLPGELVSWGGHAVIHDLSLRQSAAYASRGFSTLYGTPFGAQSFSSTSELDFGLSLADVRADFTVAATGSGGDSRVTLGGGHGVTVPNVSFPVVFSDAFSLRDRETGKELQRENTLRVQAPPLRLDLEARAGSLEGTLTQRWEARLGLTHAPFTLQNTLAVSGAGEGFSLPVKGYQGYLGSWIYGYTLLAPWHGGDPVERRANITLDWGLDTLPVGVQALWRHGFHSYDFLSAGRSLNSSAGMELELPILLLEDGAAVFSVTPGYRRSLEIVDPEAGAGDYAADFSGSFARIYSQRYLFGFLPFAELYCSRAEQSFLELSSDLDEADYTAEAYLRLSRRFSSRIRDLFLPSSIELSLNKRFVKDQDLIDLFNTYTVSARSTALNLFGDFGAYPLFPFYRTDEFSTSLSLSFDADGQGVRTEASPPLRGLEMNLDHFFSFEGQRTNALTFENRLNLRYDRDLEAELEIYGTRIQWADTVKLLYTWYRYPETGVRVPLLPERLGEDGYWSHLESLELELSGPGEESSWHPLNLIVSHRSSLVLPDHGEISGEISAGIDTEQTEQKQRYWRLGLRGGISVQIEF